MSDLTFSTSSVDVSSEAKDVIVTVKVADASGVDDSRLSTPYFGGHNFSTTSVFCSQWSLSSGTTNDGLWTSTCSIPQGKAAGDYYFEGNYFYDVNDIGKRCYSPSTSGSASW
jgi:hypothetical protein